MINKIYKNINNKFSRFFKFIFLIRYIFIIFFIASVIFLSIPHFFDYKKRENIIKLYLLQNYNLEIQKLRSINYKSLPSPHLIIEELDMNFHSDEIDLKTKKLLIYPKLFSIYNFNNFQVRKIKLFKNKVKTNFNNLILFTKEVLNLKNKLLFQNLIIIIEEKNENVLNLERINFKNYGYKKNIILGEIFNQKFKINFKENLKNINFKLLNTGIYFQLNFLDNLSEPYSNGTLKGRILSSNIRIDFSSKKNIIEISQLFLRDKYFSIDGKGNLKLKPFFKLNFSSKVNNINAKILKNLDLEYLLSLKDLIMKLNSEIDILFKSKKFSRKLINDLDIKTSIAYGRLNFSKNVKILKSTFNCAGNINLMEAYPILNFKCLINSPDKKELLKKFKIDYKIKNEKINLIINGNLNILSNKINFDKIESDSGYKASKEDIKYFKSTFENILFNKNFLNIFELSKIKRFILEVL